MLQAEVRTSELLTQQHVAEKIRCSNNLKVNINTVIKVHVLFLGLDIPNVEVVINHSIPAVPKDYIHRVGRTARAGRAGTSISLVTPSDIGLIHAIEKTINTKLKEYTSVNGESI